MSPHLDGGPLMTAWIVVTSAAALVALGLLAVGSALLGTAADRMGGRR